MEKALSECATKRRRSESEIKIPETSFGRPKRVLVRARVAAADVTETNLEPRGAKYSQFYDDSSDSGSETQPRKTFNADHDAEKVDLIISEDIGEEKRDRERSVSVDSRDGAKGKKNSRATSTVSPIGWGHQNRVFAAKKKNHVEVRESGAIFDGALISPEARKSACARVALIGSELKRESKSNPITDLGRIWQLLSYFADIEQPRYDFTDERKEGQRNSEFQCSASLMVPSPAQGMYVLLRSKNDGKYFPTKQLAKAEAAKDLITGVLDLWKTS